MLPQLRLAVWELHASTRSWPRRVRTFASLDQSRPSDVDAPPDGLLPTSVAQSLPPPAEYRSTPSTKAYYAYDSSSSSQDAPPILDIPPESDPLLAYLTAHLMNHGKRHAAARRTSRMLLHLHAFTRSPPMPIFREAVFRAAPSIRIVSHKKGGKNVQKPMPLGEKQRIRYAIKWMLAAAESRSGKTIEERFAREVLGVIREKPEDNQVLKKKAEVHRLGMVNRANAKVRL